MLRLASQPQLYNKATESALLATLLKTPIDIIIEVAGKLKESDFGTRINNHNVFGTIFGIIKYLVTHEQEVNTTNIIKEIIKVPDIYSALGGDAAVPSTIRNLGNIECNTNDIPQYVEEIQKYSIARQMLQRNRELDQQLVSQVHKMSLSEIMVLPEKLMVTLGNDYELEGGHIAEGIDYYNQIALEDIGKITGIPSRWDLLNKYLLGYQEQCAYIISGYTNEGKSIVLLNEADHIANNLMIPTLYLDTEMFKKQQHPRLISLRCGHATQNYPDLYLSPREIKLGYHLQDSAKCDIYHQQVQKIKNGQLYFCSVDSFDEDVLARIIRYYIVKYGIKVVIFDYIKMPRVDRKDGLNETQKLGNLTDFLKNTVAKKWNTVLITAAQTDEKERSRVADSARLKRYCDVLMNWRMRPFDQVYAGTHELEIQKNRDKEDEREINMNFAFIGKTAAIIEGDNCHLGSVA